MKLNELSDHEGASHARKRLGRGIGSGLGKTSGRGHKGQKARSGVAIKGFEGGQMPIHRRLPKRGFVNPTRKFFNAVNLGRVQTAIDAGKLDGKKTIDIDALIGAGIIRRSKDGVRLLATGEIKGKIKFAVQGASKAALAAVEKVGGQVDIVALKKTSGSSEAKPDEKRPKKSEKKSETDK